MECALMRRAAISQVQSLRTGLSTINRLGLTNGRQIDQQNKNNEIKTSSVIGSCKGAQTCAPMVNIAMDGGANCLVANVVNMDYAPKQGRMPYAPTKTLFVILSFLFTFHFSLFTSVLAQRDINTDLPLVTVGTALGWIPSGDEVEFTLSADAYVKLSIYSPSVDLNELGDELYDGQLLETTFTLNADGTLINTQSYQFAPSEWVTFYEGSLAASRYMLRSDVVGKGKNVYLLKLETTLPDIVLQAETITVNVSGRDFADAFTFDIRNTNACQLEFYDGDGPSELEAQLVLPTGYVQPIAVSADLETTTQYLPRVKGTYTVQLRLPEGAYQKTNSVRFRVLCANESQLLTHTPSNQVAAPEPKPIEVVVIDTAGNALEIPYTVSEGVNRDVVLAEDAVYTLVEVITEGGEQRSQRTVRFGLEGGKVTYILEKPAPLPEPAVEMTPPVLVPLPEPELDVPQKPELILSRMLDRDALLPCQVERVTLSVRNDGNAAETFTLRETIPQGYLVVASGDAISDGNTLIWQGEIVAGESASYTYQLQATSASQPQSSLLAMLETNSETKTDKANIYRYDILTSLERLSPEGTLYVGDEAMYKVTFENPLEREVTLTPQVASSRLTLLGIPQSVTVPAKSSVTATLKVRVETDGTAILRVTPFACDAGFIEEHAAGNTADLREEVQVVPPLPGATQKTTVIVDMAAYRLPVIDGLVLVQHLPTGASYILGSTRINGEAATDPLQATIPADEERTGSYLVVELPDVHTERGRSASIGEVRFDVLHDGSYWAERDDSSLIVLTPKPEVLIGDEAALRYYNEAVPLEANVAVRERTGAVILSPANGTVIRSGSTVSITVDTPLEDTLKLFVNDAEITDDRIGTKTLDRGVSRQTYDYIGLPLAEGRNLVKLESQSATGEVLRDEIEVYLSGVPELVTITPLGEVVADSATPLEFEVRVEDAWGNAPVDSFVTLELDNAKPAEPDADTQQAGYQIAFVNGKGLLSLEPLTEPKQIRIRAVIGRELGVFTFEADSNLRPWIVNGNGSLGMLYGDGFKFGVGGSFFARGSIFDDYLLTLSANYPFDPLGPFSGTTARSFETFPVTGSSGILSYDAFSQQGVYVRLERGQSYAQYGDFATTFYGELLGLSRNYTGLSFAYNPNAEGFGVYGYAAIASPGDRVTDLYIRADGTRDYVLPDNDIKLETLLLEVVKGDCDTPRDFISDNDPLLGSLQQGVDYVADRAGIIRLVDRLPLTDANGNCYYLKANYQLSPQSAERKLQAGAQASYKFGVATVRLGVYQENLLNNDFARVISAGASVGDETDVNRTGTDKSWRGEAEVAYGQNQDSSGIAATLQIAYKQNNLSAEAKYRFFATGYRSAVMTDASSAGHELKLGAGYTLTPNFILSLDAQWRQYAQDDSSLFKTSLLATYKANTDLTLGSAFIGRDPSVQFGVQYDVDRQNASALRAVIGAGLSDSFGVKGFGVNVTHRQSVGVGTSITDFSVSYQLLTNLSLRLTEQITWGNSSLFILGLETGFDNHDFLTTLCYTTLCNFNDPTINLGTTKITAQYELSGGTSGQAGAVSLAANTEVPVNDNVMVNAGASQRLDVQDGSKNETVLSVGAAYNEPDTVRGEVSYDLRFGVSLKQVLFAGATFKAADRLYGQTTVDVLGDSSRTSDSTTNSGFKFSLAGAYRGDVLSILARHELRAGRFEENNQTALTGDTRVNYLLNEVWSLRGGYIYDLQAELGFRDMLSLGASAYLWEGGFVTGYGRLFHNWQDNLWSLGLTLEASQEIACGVYGVGGINLFDGTSQNYGGVFGEPGVFLRLDVVFDEEWRCGSGDIGGVIFIDADADGVRDDTETGRSGVTLELYDVNQNLVATTYSREDGSYVFLGVSPQTYILRVVLPYDYSFTTSNVSSEGFTDALNSGSSVDIGLRAIRKN
jgi:hypothetical protein